MYNGRGEKNCLKSEIYKMKTIKLKYTILLPIFQEPKDRMHKS